MPVGSDSDFRRKQAAIAAGARAAGFEAVFPSYDPEKPSFDLEAVLKQFQASSVILADLTGERPSCYYELGIAEALGCPVIVIATLGADIHQTNMRARTRFYRDLSDLAAVTETELRRFESEQQRHAAE
jgi:nucleoside 2-deoxyribosyltransferase